MKNKTSFLTNFLVKLPQKRLLSVWIIYHAAILIFFLASLVIFRGQTGIDSDLFNLVPRNISMESVRKADEKMMSVTSQNVFVLVADKDFVREMWPRMVTLMEYVEGRLNSDGMAEGQPDDWIFVDWVDFPMHKRGTLCFEQILLMKAMETMGECAKLLGINKTDYREKSEALRNRIKQTFWNDEKKAYYHAIEEGQMNKQITKFPNMFAILYGLAHEEQRKEIMQSVMLNPDIDPITTPYMRFYELETLCMDGLQTQVLQEIRDYWGGMLREGATSFWEKYNPEETGTQHLAMYGRPYGKSLCHAWGASPVYLIGKYYLGVQPTKPGYEEYIVKPDLGDLQWMEGDVPTPFGKIHVAMNKYEVTIYSDGGHGILIIGEKTIEIPAKQEIKIAL